VALGEWKTRPSRIISTGMQNRTRLEARALLVSVTLGSLAAAAFVAAGIARMAADVWLPVSSLTAALLLAATPLANRVAAWARVPRGPAGTPLGALGVAPLLFLGAGFAMGDPIVASHWRCGTGDAALAMLAPPAFAVLGALGGAVATLVVPRAPAGGRAARWIGLGALGLCAALVAWAAARSARWPGPDAYVRSLPVMATLEPAAAGTPVTTLPASPPSTFEPQAIYRDRLGDLEIERRCQGEYCTASLGAPARDPLGDARKHAEEGASVRIHQPLVVRRDEAHDLWILEGSGRDAYRGPALELTDVGVALVKDTLAPPPGWTVGAAAGVLFGALLRVRRRRAAARLARLAAAPAGVLGDDGWIALEGGAPPVRVAPDLGLPRGPVLLLADDGTTTPGRAYRGEAPLGPGAVVAGEREELVTRAGDEVAALDALALAAPLLTAAPLVAAWVQLAGPFAG
jgi:hypothetical protein